MYPAARLAFCPNKYKPPFSNDEVTRNNSESCNIWTDLQRDSLIAAHYAGNPIISNGSQQSNKCDTKNRMFRWGIFHRSTRTSAMELSDPSQYQHMSLVSDQKNNRVEGKHLPKRI